MWSSCVGVWSVVLYTRLMLSNLTSYQPDLPTREMYMQLWDSAEQHMSYINTYILMSYQKCPDTRAGNRPPLLVSGLFCQCGVFVHVLDFYDCTIPTFVMFFAGKLFISLVSEVFMECS